MSASDDTTDAVAEAGICRTVSGGHRQSMCAWESGHSVPHAWDCDGLRERIEDLEAMCASYVDTIGKSNAENAYLEAELAAVTRERDDIAANMKLAEEIVDGCCKCLRYSRKWPKNE